MGEIVRLIVRHDFVNIRNCAQDVQSERLHDLLICVGELTGCIQYTESLEQ